MTTKKIIILSSSLLLASFGIYVYFNNRVDSSSFQKHITVKLDTNIDPNTIPEAADVANDGSDIGSQIAMINGEIFFLNTEDGTYISDSGNIYDPTTESLTTTGNNATSTHIDASQVKLITN